MFDLKASDLQLKILDCAAGPSSFNAELHELESQVVSSDPIYEFSTSDIAQQIGKTHDAILNATRETHDNFVWRQVLSVDTGENFANVP